MLEIHYSAHWTPKTAALQSNPIGIARSSDLSLVQKVTIASQRSLQILLATVLFPLKSLARSMTLPTSQTPRKEWEALNQKWEQKWQGKHSPYEPTALQLTTPDGASIHGTFYRQRWAGNDIPTIVCFNHNRCLSKSDNWDWLISKGEKSSTPFNVIVFDYRGTDQQTKVNNTRELVLDGETVVQCAIEKLGVSPKNLHYLGFSIGGGVSAQVAANNPETGRIANRSSFSSLGAVLQNSPEIDDTVPPVLLPFVPKFLLPLFWNKVTKWVVAKVNGSIGWELDATPALRSLKDRLLIAYHPSDRLIPPQVGAIAAIGKKSTSQQAILSLKPTVTNEYPQFDYHLAPFQLLQDVNGMKASKRILNFLLNTPPAPSGWSHHSYRIAPSGEIQRSNSF